MKEFRQIGQVYWFAKNPYTLEALRYFDDEFDREIIRQGKAFPTREDGLIALNLAYN